MKNKKLLATALMSVFMSTGLMAQSDSTAVDEFDFDMDMSLEDLMGMEITSASKKAERLQDVSSAIYVINQNDIARSSATKITELLQNVPGMFVVDNKYNLTEVNSRAPIGNFVGTMLVLVDGVPAQSPFSSGVTWADLDLPLNEIDRIEIIRGPGGTIYGANAATGVINIFTKNAKDRNEAYASVDYGDNNYINTRVGISKNINEKSAFSIYGKARLFDGFDRLEYFEGDNPTVPYASGDSDIKAGDSTITNQITQDVWKSETYTIGGKFEHEISENTALRISGNYNKLVRDAFAYSINSYLPAYSDSSYMTNYGSSRSFINAKLDHSFNENHSLFLNGAYKNHSDNTFVNGGYKFGHRLIDLEVQDNFTYKFNSLSAGANIRNVTFNVSDIVNENNVNYADKENNNKMLLGGFIQDKMSFLDNKLDVTLGIKGEIWQLVSDNMYFSPSAKFAYKPNEKHTVWGSASRAVTTPGFIHTNISLEFINYGSAADWNSTATYVTALQLLNSGQASDMNDALSKATMAIQNDPTIINQVFAGATGNHPNALGKAIKLTNGETTPSIYDWFELGYRTSAINKVSIEANAFLNYSKDMIGAGDVQNDPKDWIEDPASPGDTIIPLYYTNALNGMSFGGEVTIKAMPVDYLTLEASYAILKTQESSISDDEVTKDFSDYRHTPMSTIKFKAYLDLPKGFAVNLTGDYADKFSAGDSYDYVNQRWPSILGSSIDYRVNEWNVDRVRLNLKVSKKMMDGKMTAYLWGNDLLEDGTVVRTRQFAVPVPTQIHRMYGFGITAKF